MISEQENPNELLFNKVIGLLHNAMRLFKVLLTDDVLSNHV